MEPESLACSLELAGVEDEEITAETAAALDQAEDSLARGEAVSYDDVLREFGLVK